MESVTCKTYWSWLIFYWPRWANASWVLFLEVSKFDNLICWKIVKRLSNEIYENIDVIPWVWLYECSFHKKWHIPWDALRHAVVCKECIVFCFAKHIVVSLKDVIVAWWLCMTCRGAIGYALDLAWMVEIRVGDKLAWSGDMLAWIGLSKSSRGYTFR